MKLLQKSLLFASLVALGSGVASIPALTTGNGIAQAATTTTTKNLTADGFYYRVSKDRLVKASDVQILTKDDQTDSSMIETDTPNDFRLEVTVKKADLYNLKGEKVSDHLTKGTVCTIGNEDEFTQSTYYKASSKDKLVQLNESSWL
ncbi:hypothetical protein [Companilactobacillus muriivasis]|uniref:hypothetical protein n=1 Tax=Companilactobacillus muriivasis TaxID=3081444 RepID=UPI0030C72CD5